MITKSIPTANVVGMRYHLFKGKVLELAFPDAPLTNAQLEVLKAFKSDCYEEGIDVIITTVK